jgi:hypothetical protein
MPPAVRKLVLAVHLAVSVGWLGAAAAYIPLDVAASTSDDLGMLRAAYLAMDTIVRYAIVPLGLLALLTGILVSVGTKWGLVRHWWVLVSLVLTTFAVVVLVVESTAIGAYAAVAAQPGTSVEQLRSFGGTLLHSVGGAVVLLVVLVLNVFKPRGMTAYGWRKQREEARGSA